MRLSLHACVSLVHVCICTRVYLCQCMCRTGRRGRRSSIEECEAQRRRSLTDGQLILYQASCMFCVVACVRPRLSMDEACVSLPLSLFLPVYFIHVYLCIYKSPHIILYIYTFVRVGCVWVSVHAAPTRSFHLLWSVYALGCMYT